MLNSFLVLGQVPGTNFQITFNDILALLALTLIIYLSFRHQPDLRQKWLRLRLNARVLYWRISQDLHRTPTI